VAKRAGYTAVIRTAPARRGLHHRDIAVGTNAMQIKTGPCRARPHAKYNQLLRIEEELARARPTPGVMLLTTSMTMP